MRNEFTSGFGGLFEHIREGMKARQAVTGAFCSMLATHFILSCFNAKLYQFVPASTPVFINFAEAVAKLVPVQRMPKVLHSTLSHACQRVSNLELQVSIPCDRWECGSADLIQW